MSFLAYIGPALGPRAAGWPLWMWISAAQFALLLVGPIAVGLAEWRPSSRGPRS